ncbi:MAG: hypothetical protein JXQ77_00750 [Campylobacterales bacterium]|nr:hypothetical protein [Campylobacterales bacterium]
MNVKIYLAIFGIASLVSYAQEVSSSNIIMLEQKIQEQNERIDGLTSLVEGLNVKIMELEEINRNQDSKNDMKLIQHLGKMIDDLNASCVKKDELYKILKANSKIENVTLSSKSSTKELAYANGITLFRAKQYDKAQEQFLDAKKQGYKAASTNYYLGEIAYYQKRYKDAIFYYKSSAKLDDKANYIDTLLLHTAISLENTNDKAQAKLFYETIIKKYPANESAKIAKSKLDGMK